MALNIKLKRYSGDSPHSYSFGVYPTLELIEYIPHHVLGVLIHSKGSKNEGIRKLRQFCKNHQIEIIENDRLLEKLADRGNTYAIGIFNKYPSELSRINNHIILVNPSSMGNLGTIIRSMIGFGYTDLGIIDPAADHFDPRVIRASMGAIFQCRIQRFISFQDYQESYHKHQFYSLMTNGKITLPEVKFQSPHAMIFGSEASGLSEEFLEIGTSIRIPQNGLIDSINLALSVGITMYHHWINQSQ
jgi:TrmH family RNA methyltransferase